METVLFPVQQELNCYSEKHPRVQSQVSLYEIFGGQRGTGRGFVRELRISSVTIISRIRRTSGRSPRNFNETIPFRKSGIIGRKSIFAFFEDSKHVCLFSDRLQFPVTHNYLLTDAVKAKPLKLSK